MPPRRKLASASTSAHASTSTSAATSAVPSRAPSPTPRQPFRFFDLPPELRLRIYEDVLLTHSTLDLDPSNSRRVHPRLSLFLASHRLHEEAYRVFYAQPLRLFPLHGRFFYTKRPLLARLPTRYRAALTTIELRLGPGWTKPPRCQDTWRDDLGLADCTSLRCVKIMVEIDTSDSVFMGFRGAGATEDTYKLFCVNLLRGVLARVPGLDTVEIDAFPGVKRESPLVLALKRLVESEGNGVKLVWGPLRGWEDEKEGTASVGKTGLEGLMGGLGLGSEAVARVVEVQA